MPGARSVDPADEIKGVGTVLAQGAPETLSVLIPTDKKGSLLEGFDTAWRMKKAVKKPSPSEKQEQ
jgi:hypothetical protein